ncbi:MAG: ATP-binding protein, partial [Rectinema sp.]|nr:ATP-binding protein [Rectinema sp.]
MSMEVYAHEPLGFDGVLVRVEADLRPGIPAVEIVGLASTAVREARERARIAIRRAGFAFPSDRILVNLSPADLPKEGSAYDLPIAIKVLCESGQVPTVQEPVLALGELTLSGDVRAVRGVLPAVRAAKARGIRHCIVPFDNAAEAARVDSVFAWPITNLGEVVRIIARIDEGKTPEPSYLAAPDSAPLYADMPDFSDIRGGQALLRALLVAAAGQHHVFLAGPPGAGKTMAALRFPSILPDLDENAALDIASLYSLRGDGHIAQWTTRPPFRAPHHSATLEGMLGGARPLRPGEVSLAHHGVLFLDECPEFRRDVLQSL